MLYLIDGPNDLEQNPVLIKDAGLPVIFAFHGIYLSGESLVLTDRFREQHSITRAPPFDYFIRAVNRTGYHGSSVVKLGQYSYTELALDVEEMANSLGISKFGVVGHSSGAHTLSPARQSSVPTVLVALARWIVTPDILILMTFPTTL